MSESEARDLPPKLPADTGTPPQAEAGLRQVKEGNVKDMGEGTMRRQA